jgi:hypothetical protein
MLLSFFMVTVFLYVAVLAAAAQASGLADAPGWEWCRLAAPGGVADLLLLLLYCAGILGGQHAQPRATPPFHQHPAHHTTRIPWVSF